MTELWEFHKRLFPNGPSIQWAGVPNNFREELLSYSIRSGIEASKLWKLIRVLALAQFAEKDFDDPRIAGGEFKSLEGRTLDYDLDIGLARSMAESDASCCGLILHSNPSIEDLMRVHRNSTGWMWFFAARHPNIAARALFEQYAAELEAQLHQLIKLKEPRR